MLPNPEETTQCPNLIISVFRSLTDSDSLFDFQTPITEDVFVTGGTAQIFRKRSEQHRLRRARVVGKRQAMNGEVPGFDFEMLLNLTARKKQAGTQYELAPSQIPPLPLTGAMEVVNDLPFICLNNHGRTN
jgi:hypothetical protein